jgi:hypothetical protein
MSLRDQKPVISVVEAPDLTAKKLRTMLFGDSGGIGAHSWLDDFDIQYLPWQEQARRTGEWRAAIDRLGPDLWNLFVGRLDAGLQRLGIRNGQEVIWFPAGALGLLPLGIARNPDSGRHFLDLYEVIYAPNAQTLVSIKNRLQKEPRMSLVAVIDPTGDITNLDLPFAAIEGNLVVSHFSKEQATRLDQSNADLATVLKALRGKSYWYFSSHGKLDRDNPLQAGLKLKSNAALTVGDLLDSEATLGQPRLVVLSACETGLFESRRNPNEFIGLPTTFIQLGAAGVLSTLWQVDDLATALLIAKFYVLHIDEKIAPPNGIARSAGVAPRRDENRPYRIRRTRSSKERPGCNKSFGPTIRFRDDY